MAPRRPETPLASSTLLTRNPVEPSLGTELTHEIGSADRIDVLIAFISKGGFRALKSALDAKGMSSAQVIAASLATDGTLTLITKKKAS